jgi:hypothetical protein
MFHLHMLSRKVAINHNRSAIEPSVDTISRAQDIFLHKF